MIKKPLFLYGDIVETDYGRGVIVGEVAGYFPIISNFETFEVEYWPRVVWFKKSIIFTDGLYPERVLRLIKRTQPMFPGF